MGLNQSSQAQLPVFGSWKLDFSLQLPTSNSRKLELGLEEVRLNPYGRPPRAFV